MKLKRLKHGIKKWLIAYEEVVILGIVVVSVIFLMFGG